MTATDVERPAPVDRPDRTGMTTGRLSPEQKTPVMITSSLVLNWLPG